LGNSGALFWFFVWGFVVLFLFLVKLGFELRASALAKQAIYHLSHASSPFYSVIWKQSLVNYLPELASNSDCPDLSLPSS
jgi:hypothetical protein